MNVQFTTYPIEEWVLDEENLQVGNPELTVDAIAQDIKFILSTERNKYPIMGSNFGIELVDLIGKDRQYVQAQIKKRINEALSIDDRILAIGSFKFESKEMGSLSVSFVVETVLGKVGMSTEILS